MIPKDFIDLALHTLRAPQDAARQIMSLNLGRDALWTGLALVAALNAVLFAISLQLAPASPAMPGVFLQPLSFFVVLCGVLVVMVYGLLFIGRAMGGQGDLADLLALVVWLQALRAVAQVGLLLIMAISLDIAAIASLFVGFLGLWILVNFIAAALRFDRLGRAVGVLCVAMICAVVGAMLLGAVVGVAILEGPANV